MLARAYRRWGRPLLRSRGYQLAPLVPPDYTADERHILEEVRPFTMVGTERIADTCAAVRYVVRHDVRGAFVECGVWRGGVVMAMALQLLTLERTDRDLWLYDTFAGMTPPTDADVTTNGARASSDWEQWWEPAGADEVRRAVVSTGYPVERLRLVAGPVEETIPGAVPERIAVLRLDTDWYESTRHELEHLWPLLEPGGVLLVDDYGRWEGARQAVDAYLLEHGIRMFLHRSDIDGRVGVKQG